MRYLALAACLSACHSTAKPTLTYGETCGDSAQCVSGDCLTAPDGTKFCSKSCAADTDCFSNASLFCCEYVGTTASCQKGQNDACPAATLGGACSSPNDPLCVRAGLECATVDSGQVCTKACSSDADCVALAGATCGTSDGRNLCNPPSNATEQSNCGGDSDCTSGQLCQIFPNNQSAPTALITQCSSTTFGATPAFSACTEASGECDRDFCIDGLCPSTCVNDSYCPSGFVCTRLNIDLTAATSTTAAIVGFAGFCTKQNGSFAPCPRNDESCDATCTDATCPCTASSCPSGEACGAITHFDGSSDDLCETEPTSSVSGAVTGVAVSDVCSPLDSGANPIPVVAGASPAAVRICATPFPDGQGTCLATAGNASVGYCTGPCVRDADCPTTQPSNGGATIAAHCVYFPFEEICLEDDFNGSGDATGATCSGADAGTADAECQSFDCDATSGQCAERQAAGTACTRADQCDSFVCSTTSNTCLQPCRDGGDCAACNGTSCGVCDANPFLIDVNDTPNDTSDDVFDLPTFCDSLPAADGALVACHGDSAGCSNSEACRVVFRADGGTAGICTTPPSGGAGSGASCSQDADCNSNLCLGQTNASSCASVCNDDTDCTGKATAMRCLPVTLFGRAVNTLCLAPVSSAAADGAACTQSSDCQSNLCANGACAALCSGTTVGTSGAQFCVPTPVSVDLRFTNSTVDDRYGYVLANLPNAQTCVQDGASACVYRPTSATTMQGFTLTPNSDARAAGASCRLATNCQSGLCVNGACAVPCDPSAANCASGQTCTAAQALTYEDAYDASGALLTAPVNVCLSSR